MKFALALMVLDERHWLELHLPVLLQAKGVDGLVLLDGGSSDGSVFIAQSIAEASNVPFFLAMRPFDWDFSAHGNALIETCERCEFDAMLRLDPDELMWPDQIDQIKRILDMMKVMRFARYNFVSDRCTYSPARYPDWQTRAWVLHQGVRYSGMKVHETIERSIQTNGWRDPGDVYWSETIKIYHYGLIAPNDARFFMKHHNYSLLSQGKDPLTALPSGFVVPQPEPLPLDHANVDVDAQRRHAAPFEEAQPLNPFVCGVRAPF